MNLSGAVKTKLKKGDMVVIIAGREKGKQGKIKEILKKKNRATVEGLNMITRHTKPTQKNPQGGKTTEEGTLHISNLMLLDPKSGKPTRIGSKVSTDKKTGKNTITRYAKDSGTELK